MACFLLISTVLLAGFRSVLSKIGNKYLHRKQDIFVFNFWLFLASALLITIKYVVSGSYEIGMYTILLAVLYAFFTLMSQILFMKATDNGDVARSSLLYSCGFIFPTLFGAVVYNEELTALKIVGILLILFSFMISTKSKNEKMSEKWFVYSFLAMFSSGMVGVLQKIFRMSHYAHQLNGFLFVAFLVIITAMYTIMPKEKSGDFTPEFFLTAVLIGICFGIVNIINTYLSGVMSSVVMFPIVNGGGIISSGVVAYIILKEQLTMRKWIGILIGIVGILCIAV